VQKILPLIRACILLVSILDYNPALASPWTRPKGSIFLTAGSDIFSATGDFQFDPPPLEDSPDDRFQRIQSNAYVEYGLSDKWLVSLKGSYSFFTVRSPNATSSNANLSEIEGLLQRQIFKGKTNPFSLALAAGQNNSLAGGTRPGFQSDGIDTEVRALYGRTFATKPFQIFAGTEVAYRRRFGIAADQIRADIKFGFEPHKRLLFLIDGFTVTSLRNNTINSDGLVGADFDVIKIEPSVAIRVTKGYRLQFGGNFEIAGRNIERGRSFFVNLWSEF